LKNKVTHNRQKTHIENSEAVVLLYDANHGFRVLHQRARAVLDTRRASLNGALALFCDKKGQERPLQTGNERG